MISKGRTESSEGKRDCRQKLTNCAKRKATPVSQVDFLLPVGAKVLVRIARLKLLAAQPVFFWPARGGGGGSSLRPPHPPPPGSATA